MKKMLFLILVAMLLYSFSATVLADDLNASDPIGITTISYDVSESYVITIPAYVVISTTGVESTLSASSVLIPDGKTLSVSITSKNNYHLEYANSKIPYTISDNETEQNTGTFIALTIESGTTSDEVILVFKTTDEAISQATKSGNHTDILTFNCTTN